MIKRTKTNFGIALVYSVILVITLGFTVFIVYNQGSKLEQTKLTIAEHTAKEAAYTNVMRLLESSAADRAALRTYFINEKDTISFISELESAASTIGVVLETTELSVAPTLTKDGVTTPAVLTLGVEYTGEEAAVKKFTLLLENVPYHKQIPEYTVTRDVTTGVWVGKTMLRITMTP